MAPLFTDATRATAGVDSVAALRSAIVDVIQLSSTADRTVTAPILNHMLISFRYGTPPRKYPIRSASTLTTALNAVVAGTATRVVFHLNTAPIFITPDAYTVMTFDGLSTTPIQTAGVACVGAGTGAGPAGPAAIAAAAAAVSAATALSPAAAAAAAAATNANQAFVAQQAAAAAAAAAINHAVFDHQNLPLEV